jgi:ketosteroid isomerase-like protein
MHRFLEQWERLSLAARELQVVGDTVLVRVVRHGKGRVSGIEGGNWYFMLFTFRGGKIVRMEVVSDEGEALEAAGLREKGAPATPHLPEPVPRRTGGAPDRRST